jgi:WD40 repeat protein/serine/threonine protein kinase
MGLCVQCLLGIGLPGQASSAAAPGVPPSGGPENEPTKAGIPSGTVVIAAPESHAPFEQPGDHIGRYKLLQKIGEGGCGVVYMAEQEEPVRRKVALKVIKLGMDTKSVIARFEAERQALALMDHPNIAKVLDAGATDTGRPYFVMELVRGVRITDYCDQHDLPTRERLNLVMQVCHAIQHAHQKGIIHRDIKPSNILVTLHDGVPAPKVIDFGIAKATSDQRLTDKTLFTAFEQFIGTPAYMSPEQAEMSGLDIDTRSDIYALGVLLYELLTGRTPFDAKRLLQAGLGEIRRIIREEEPPRPSTCLSTLTQADLTAIAKHHQSEPARLTSLMRGDLDWIAMKCLEKDRTRRYETANGLAADIERHLSNEPVTAGPPSNLYRFQKMVRRNKVTFAAAGTVVAALVIGLGISLWQSLEKTKAYRRAAIAEKDQGLQRQRAEAEARRAGTAEAEARMTLAAADFSQAIRLIEQDEASDALPYLVRSLRNSPTKDAALTRLTTLLTYHSWMLPTLILKHGGTVACAQFSPDAKRIVTASADKTARVWDAQTGLPLTEPLKHDGTVSSAEFSPEGNRVVTASADKTARVWDAQTGQPLTEPLKHGGTVSSAQFSPEGTRIATASEDGTARVWDAQTGQPLGEPLKHAGGVISAEFSPEGKRIVTASRDGTARVWDAQTGQPLATPPILATGRVEYPGGRDAGFVSSARFSPDGKRIVTASNSGRVRVWDAQSGQPLTEPMKHSPYVIAQFSPDGKRLLTASYDRSARVWDAQTGQPLGEPLKHKDRLSSAEFSPDGKRVVTASEDKTARVWDTRTGQPVAERLEHPDRVSSARFSLDGKSIVTASYDGTARVWEARFRKALTLPLKHETNVISAQFSPDAKRIATASADWTVRLWDAQTGQPLAKPLKHDDWVTSAQFSPDGKRIITASRDGTTRMWDAQTGQSLTGPLKHGTNVASVHFSFDGQRIVTASWDGTARVWDMQTGQPLAKPLKHDDWVTSAQFSPDGKRIVTASRDQTARVWDAQTGRPTTEPLKHGQWVHWAQFSPDGGRIVTAAMDNTTRLWNAQTGQPLTEPLKREEAVSVPQFSPDGQHIVTFQMFRSTARVWDAQTGQPLTQPLKHELAVHSAQFCPDGKRIITVSMDKTARVWEAQTGQPLTEPLKHDGTVSSAQSSPDGRRIVTASADQTARVWDIAPTNATFPNWLLELSEAVSGQALNKQGLLEPTKLNRAEILQQIRQKLNQQSGDDDWTVWGRWFLADPSTRTISPFSKVMVSEANR